MGTYHNDRKRRGGDSQSQLYQLCCPQGYTDTFDQYLAKNHVEKEVSFNNITPGSIHSDHNADVLSDLEFYQIAVSKIPRARIGESEDCAGIAQLLASDADSYINGANVSVDGGMRL